MGRGERSAAPTSSMENIISEDDAHAIGLESRQHVQAMRDLIKLTQRHPTTDRDCSSSGPEVLARFLWETDWDVSAAYARWQSWMEWRATAKPDLITLDMVTKELQETNKVKVGGRDTKGRPWVIFSMARHRRGQFPIPDTMNLMLYTIESALIESRRNGQGGCIGGIIFDCAGITSGNMDLTLAVKRPGFMTILQEWYPHAYDHLVFLHTNVLIRTFYRILERYLDEADREVIHFLAGPDDLVKMGAFDEDGLPDEFKPLLLKNKSGSRSKRVE